MSAATPVSLFAALVGKSCTSSEGTWQHATIELRGVTAARSNLPSSPQSTTSKSASPRRLDRNSQDLAHMQQGVQFGPFEQALDFSFMDEGRDVLTQDNSIPEIVLSAPEGVPDRSTLQIHEWTPGLNAGVGTETPSALSLRSHELSLYSGDMRSDSGATGSSAIYLSGFVPGRLYTPLGDSEQRLADTDWPLKGKYVERISPALDGYKCAPDTMVPFGPPTSDGQGKSETPMIPVNRILLWVDSEANALTDRKDLHFAAYQTDTPDGADESAKTIAWDRIVLDFSEGEFRITSVGTELKGIERLPSFSVTATEMDGEWCKVPGNETSFCYLHGDDVLRSSEKKSVIAKVIYFHPRSSDAQPS